MDEEVEEEGGGRGGTWRRRRRTRSITRRTRWRADEGRGRGMVQHVLKEESFNPGVGNRLLFNAQERPE